MFGHYIFRLFATSSLSLDKASEQQVRMTYPHILYHSE